MELLEGGSNKGKTLFRLSVPPNILLFFLPVISMTDILTLCIKHLASFIQSEWSRQEVEGPADFCVNFFLLIKPFLKNAIFKWRDQNPLFLRACVNVC